jgi:hypothetical protein
MPAFHVVGNAFKRTKLPVCDSAINQRFHFFVSASRPKLRSSVVQIESMFLLMRVCPGSNFSDRRGFGESTHDGFLVSIRFSMPQSYGLYKRRQVFLTRLLTARIPRVVQAHGRAFLPETFQQPVRQVHR